MDWTLKEAIEIKLHPDKMNREDGFSLSLAWKPVTHDLREQRQSHTEVPAPSSGPWKGLTMSILLSLHHHHLSSPLLIPT
jgi:hypothetical protein